MKNFGWSLLILCSSIAMTALAGCGDASKPKSMTDGVELSEIQAYEQAVLDMEAEDAGAMDEVKE